MPTRFADQSPTIEKVPLDAGEALFRAGAGLAGRQAWETVAVLALNIEMVKASSAVLAR